MGLDFRQVSIIWLFPTLELVVWGAVASSVCMWEKVIAVTSNSAIFFHSGPFPNWNQFRTFRIFTYCWYRIFFLLRGIDMRKENRGTSWQVLQTLSQGPSSEVMKSVKEIPNSSVKYETRTVPKWSEYTACCKGKYYLIKLQFHLYQYYLYDDLNSYCGS